MANSQVLTCYVWLVDSDPPIWRRFQVDDQISLADLHPILQAVMGWEDSHRHRFQVRGDYYATPDPTPLEDTLDAGSKMLADFSFLPNEKFAYTYDFGDGWLHQITVEMQQPMTEPLTSPRCLAGERACPPEDSGGVWGYEDLLERFGDPDDPEYEELLDWLGGDFDSEKFDLQQINQRLLS